MKTLWSYFVPIMVILGGISVLASDPNKPYSSTIPVVFGQYQMIIGLSLIVAGLLIGASVFIHLRKTPK